MGTSISSRASLSPSNIIEQPSTMLNQTPSSPTSPTTNNSDSSLISFDIKYLEESKWWRAAVAGSIAGLTEHSLLYPIDTVKTRIQAQVNASIKPKYNSFVPTLIEIIKNEKPRALFRGLTTVLCAAIPSHGSYFTTYEYTKSKLLYKNGEHNPLKIGFAGIIACMAHDLIVTPFDVIKQRMQLFYKECPNNNLCNCAMNVLKQEGYISFFRSYPATVLLNIPVFCTNFIVYESTKIVLSDLSNQTSDDNSILNKISDDTSALHYLIAGGIAGGCAGLVSNPLDLVKTSIQTDKQTKGYISMKHSINKIISNHPNYKYRIFWLGSTSRIMYMIPSAAITWTTYELVKVFLGFPIHDLERE